jgi:hypothetical protein
MSRAAWIGAFLISLVMSGRGFGGEPPCGEPSPGRFLQGVGPAGGWDPYGGGLLHWWPAHCFPRCGGPDDYCRKKLPPVCWPPYPPWYIEGPPETCCPPRRAPACCNPPH